MKVRLLLATSLVLAAALPAAASAQSAPQAASSAKAAPLPIQLGPNARQRYSDIFATIRQGLWADANAKLAAMERGPLHDVARAELYLAKGSPKVEAPQLVGLIQSSPTLPQARQLAKIAANRGAEDIPQLPYEQSLGWLGTSPRRTRASSVEGETMTGLMAAKILPLIKDDRPGDAEAVVSENEALLTPAGLAEWQQRVAWSYYISGNDTAATRMADKARAGVGEWAALGDWVAGLAAWRQRDFRAAQAAFDAVSRRSGDPEMIAAGHFWAARADMAAGEPQRIQARLKTAARLSETFYGLLAQQQLGLDAKPAIDRFEIDMVEKRPNVRAALALAEIGEHKLADELIRHQARIGEAREHAALALIAGRLDLPSTQLWLAHNGPAGAQAPIAARYPAPASWRPEGGWRVDKNLVYAHALQESRFRTDVVSPAGARGLMQVMPGTAAMIARRKGLAAVGSLNSPSTNMEYGQAFMEQLRDMGATGGLLPKVIAAYNAGPLPVERWNARMRDHNDPLLYIESIPYWETRAYVTIILRNYWMYQLQAGEKPVSKVELAQGKWPRFPGAAVTAGGSRFDRVAGASGAN